MNKNLIVANNTFAVVETANSLPRIDPELQKEISDADREGFETGTGFIPIVSIRQKDLKNEKGRVIFPAGGFKMYDAISAGIGQQIADVDGQAGLTVTFLLDKTARVLFQAIGDEKPVCRSNDGKVGVGNPGGNCLECPLSQFVGGLAPKCKQLINALVYDHALKNCYIIRFVRSGLRPYGNFKESLRRAGFPIHAAVVKLSTEYQSDKGEYYIPKFEIIDNLGGDKISIFREMKALRESLKDVFGKTVEMAVEDDKPEPVETTYSEA